MCAGGFEGGGGYCACIVTFGLYVKHGCYSGGEYLLDCGGVLPMPV